jgi:RNA polymerase-binding transcription factor DksA
MTENIYEVGCTQCSHKGRIRLAALRPNLKFRCSICGSSGRITAENQVRTIEEQKKILLIKAPEIQLETNTEKPSSKSEEKTDKENQVKADEKSISTHKVYNRPSKRRHCEICDELIDHRRLVVVPTTTKCINCARNEDKPKKKIRDSFGTREEFKRDRGGWRRNSEN